MSDLPSIADLIKKTSANAAIGLPTSSTKLEDKMLEVRLQEKEDQAKTKAQSLGVPYVNLKGFPISPEAISLVPLEQAQELKTVCFLHTGPELRLGALEPKDEKIQELLFQLTERYKANGEAYQVSQESLRLAMKTYETLPKFKLIIKGVKITDTELDKFQSAVATFADIQKTVQSASITDVMTITIAAALKFNSNVVADFLFIAGVKSATGIISPFPTP